MIFTDSVEIREYDHPQYFNVSQLGYPVKFYIRLDNGVTIGFINIETADEIHTKNFNLATTVGEDTYILSPDVVNPDRPSYFIIHKLASDEEYLGLTQNVLVNFFRYYKENGNIVFCLARSFPELYCTPGWPPTIKLSIGKVNNPCFPPYGIAIDLFQNTKRRINYPPYYENTPDQIQKRESFVMHCCKGSKDGVISYLHPTTRFVINRPNYVIANPSWSIQDVKDYLNNPNIPDDKLYIGWYSYDSFLTMIDRVNTFENDDKVIPVIDSFSNYLILGFSYQETVKIREILYHRMIKRMPKQIEKTILDREQN